MMLCGAVPSLGNKATSRGMVHRVFGMSRTRGIGKSIAVLERKRDRAFDRYVIGRLAVVEAEARAAEADHEITEAERNQFAARVAWLGDALAFGRDGGRRLRLR